MHNVTERVYIFSVFNSKRTAKENEETHKDTIRELKAKHYAPTEVVGKYNGAEETSILLYGTNLTESVIEELSKKNFQESYLIVYHDGVAELVYSNGSRKILGDFISVSESEARSKDAYSKIGNQWFVIE
jgi:hypothetical protein